MPRPKNGYVNAAGQPVPGTHDPISRFMDRSALMHWAHKRGTEGLPLYARDAIDIGSAVHAMCDLDLKGRSDTEITKTLWDAGLPRDDHDKAMRAFMQFRKWRLSCHVKPIALETSLVSELHQYGGTPDCVALIEGRVSLIEFKTSVKPYADHLVAMAAHAQLWNEANSDRPIEAFHWIGLPRDGTEFKHHAYADLSPQWEIFTLYLDAWRLEKGLTRRRIEKPAAAAPSPEVAPEAASAAPISPKAKPKARARPRLVVANAKQLSMATIAPPPPEQLTMAAILRSYGHIREVPPC
jgi:hypothetical protein